MRGWDSGFQAPKIAAPIGEKAFIKAAGSLRRAELRIIPLIEQMMYALFVDGHAAGVYMRIYLLDERAEARVNPRDVGAGRFRVRHRCAPDGLPGYEVASERRPFVLRSLRQERVAIC